MTSIERDNRQFELSLPELASVARRFASIDHPREVLESNCYQIVTGFGPTNAPTAGTLSVMLGIIELQATLKAPTRVVISDLGAWNCRNIPWDDLCHYRDRMAAFLVALGFDNSQNSIRSHLDYDNLVRAGRIARYLTLEDFDAHREEFLSLYGGEGLLGSRIGLLADTLYTVADILEPIANGCSATLVISGAEESYFTRLAQLVLHRQANQKYGMNWNGRIGGMYFRVVRGLGGYPKMSKSIPKSSIHVGLSENDLRQRILSSASNDQQAILDAIDLASGWPEEECRAARIAFENLPDSSNEWHMIKRRYFDRFRHFTKIWENTLI